MFKTKVEILLDRSNRPDGDGGPGHFHSRLLVATCYAPAVPLRFVYAFRRNGRRYRILTNDRLMLAIDHNMPLPSTSP